jgi:hypothetical protein
MSNSHEKNTEKDIQPDDNYCHIRNALRNIRRGVFTFPW